MNSSKSSSSSSSSAQLLMLALPHHMDIMSNPDTVIFDGVFQCIKGDMTPIVGKKWTMQVCILFRLKVYYTDFSTGQQLRSS
jgi:endoglucanase Acf2